MGREKMASCAFVFVFLCILSGIQAQHYRFIRQPSNRTVLAGTEQITLSCYIENFRGNIVWMKNGFSWENSPFLRYSIAPSKNPGEQNLLIRNVSIEDDGKYRCQMRTTEKKLISRTAFVTVIVPPKDISILPSTNNVIDVMDGGKLPVRCQATGSKPEARIRWRFRGEDIQRANKVTEISSSKGLADSKLVTTSSVLNLSPSRVQNGSLLECIVEHQAYDSSFNLKNHARTVKATLNVLYPPEQPVVTTSFEQPVLAGTTVTVTCTSNGGNPLAALAWELNGIVIYKEYNHYMNRSTSILRHQVKAEDHNKAITCIASNPATSDSLTASMVLNVLYPPDRVEVTQYPEGAIENSSVTFTCRTTESNPRADLTWSHNGLPISQSRSFSRSSDTKSLYAQSVLTLDNVKREDRNTQFVCSASIPRLSYSKEVSKYVEVYYPPISVEVEIYYLGQPLATGAPSLLMLEEDKTIQLKCFASDGSPPSTLKWYRDGHLVSDADPLIQSGLNDPSCIASGKTCSSFEVTLSAADNGRRYECTASNPASTVPERDSTTLQVLFSPDTLSIEQSPLAPVSGQPMSLICRTASSNPVADISWFHRGNPVPSEQYEALSTIPGQFGGFIATSRLRLTPTAEDHGMIITCNAKNSILKKSINKDLSINVEFSPFFESPRYEFNATENEESLVIFVAAVANPRNVTYRWWRLLQVNTRAVWEKVPLEPSSRFSWSSREGALTIQSVQNEDAGVYILEATNPRGMAEANITINVFYPPTILDVHGPSVASVGDNVTLTCSVQNHPLRQLSIVWTKEITGPNSRELVASIANDISTLTLKDVSASDRGRYFCIASNGVGKNPRASVNVKVLFGAVIDRLETADKVALPDHSNLPARTSLACTAAGNPEVVFRWRDANGSIINGRSSSNSESKYFIDDVTLDNDLFTSRLYINIDQLNTEEKSYTCIAENQRGIDTIEIKLVPRGKPDPPQNILIVNSTMNSISLSWNPGFDGGVGQAFLLQYKLFSSVQSRSSKSNQWIEIHVPPPSTRFTLRGLLPSAVYWVRLRSKNSYGESEFSPFLQTTTADCVPTHDVTYEQCMLYFQNHSSVTGDPNTQMSTTVAHEFNITVDSTVMYSGTNGASTFNYIPVIAALCGLIFVVAVLIAVFYARKHSDRSSYRPKSYTTETTSLPTPASSLNGSEVSSADRREENVTTTTSLPNTSQNSCSNSRTTTKFTGTNCRADGSGQSLDQAMSRVSYAADGMSGRSEFSNVGASMTQDRSGTFSPSSRDTSFSSLTQDDVNLHNNNPSTHPHTQSLARQVMYTSNPMWTNKSYEDVIAIQPLQARSGNGRRAVNCLQNADIAFIQPNINIPPCAHEPSWEESCEQCNEERRQHNAIIRRASETMRYHTDSIPDALRNYHTLSTKPAQKFQLPPQQEQPASQPLAISEPYCHLFQPRGARFCGMKVQTNLPDTGYPSSIASGTSASSLGYRSGQEHIREDVSDPTCQDIKYQLKGNASNRREVASLYAVDVPLSCHLPTSTGEYQPGRLHVLDTNERPPNADERHLVRGMTEEESRIKATFLRESAAHVQQDAECSDDLPITHTVANVHSSLPPNIRQSWISSSASNYKPLNGITQEENQSLMKNQRETSAMTKPLRNSPLQISENSQRSSIASSASSTNALLPAINRHGSTEQRLSPTNNCSPSQYLEHNPPLNLRKGSQSSTPQHRNDAGQFLSVSPSFVGVDKDGTLFV